MRLYVQLKAHACDVHTGAEMEVVVEQFGHVQVGRRATEIDWGTGSGLGSIENFTPETTLITPISIMTTTGGIIVPTAAKTSVDCDFTAHVETQHLTAGNPILFNHNKGNVQLRLIISSTPDFASLGTIPKYSSKLVNGLYESISNGDKAIKTCLTSLITGLDKNQSTALLSGKKIFIPDIQCRESIKKVSEYVMHTDSEISTGLPPVHHLTQNKLMQHVRDNLTINVKEGFFIALRALDICENMGVDIQNDTGKVIDNVIASIQLEAVNNLYKYDSLLTGSYVSMGDKIYFDQTINCDSQHATNLKTEAHMIAECKALKTMLQNKAPLARVVGERKPKVDCEDSAGQQKFIAQNVSAVPLTEFETAVEIVTDLSLPDSPNIVERTRKAINICQIFKENVTVNTCIGLASAPNLTESKQLNVDAHKQPKTLSTLLKSAQGHCWTCWKINPQVHENNCNTIYKKTFEPLGCELEVQFCKDPSGFIEGTGIALSSDCKSMHQSVKFNCKADLDARDVDTTFIKKVQKLNDKIMPQFMAVSLASNIHQYMICKAYNIPNTNVVTQPRAPDFYQLKIGQSSVKPSIPLRATLEQIEKLRITQNLTEFLRGAYLGVEPGRETIYVQLYVMPLDTNYEKSIDLFAQSLAMRVMEPADQEKHYTCMMQEINEALGTNIPTDKYKSTSANQSYPAAGDLKFVAECPRDELNQLVKNGLISGIFTLNPMAHLCWIKQDSNDSHD